MLTNSSILPNQTPLLWVVRPNGTTHCMYAAWPKQMEFHTCTAKNAIYIGSRGTGKSICGRHDAHMRAMAYPNYVYCILRRKHTELLKTHVQFISDEMDLLGGHWNDTKKIAYYPNGSLGYYAHAEDENSVGNLLGSQFYYMFFDELTTFPWPLFRKLATSCRVPKRSGLTALVRAATNPLGPSAPSIRAYFDDHKVDFANDPDYVPTDWVAIHTLLDDNPSIDATEYRKQFSGLPAHVRKAWLEGEYVLEGAYFDDWSPTQDGKPWHVIDTLPTVDGKPLLDQPWVSIYRAVDWGYWPDPAVCLWIAVLPSKHAIVFKERTWYKTLAATVAKDIVRESAGMRCIETFCLPLDAPVWMGDFSFKPLQDVKVGDTVMSGPPKGEAKTFRKLNRLQHATVTAIHRTRQEVVRVTLASGRVVYCTRDHRWRSGKSWHASWVTAKIGRKFWHVIDDPGSCPDTEKACWLGGIYDGEGCRRYIAQSRDHNPEVYQQIHDYLQALGFPVRPIYKRHSVKVSGPGSYESGLWFGGGYQSAVKFSNWIPALRWRKKYAAREILVSKFRHLADEVIKIESCGVQDVGCITTTTGNFVAYGYITSNCDPTMKIKDGATVFSIAELFEINGVPVTASVNDRTTFGYAIHDFLNTLIDGRPKIQVVRPTAASPGLGCPELIRSLPQMQMDPKDPARLADSDDDHWPISLAYFCMGIAAPAQRPDQPSALRKWQRAKPRAKLTSTSPY